VTAQRSPLEGIRRIHMIGIGGAGMSALARLYLQQGVTVSGSDSSPSTALDELIHLGAQAYAGSRPDRLSGADLAVYSSAVPATDPELREVERLGIRSLKHARALGELFNTRRGIAVAGTHGKTTTSSIAAFILTRCGLSPTFQIGGEVLDLGTSAQWGTGEWMVIEADEFDRRFLEYEPEIAVINNMEPDHFEYFGDYDTMRGAFADFLRRVRPGGTVVAWGEDERLAGLLAKVHPPRVARFGIDEGGTAGWDLRASAVQLNAGGSRFTVSTPDGVKAQAQVAIPGIHNARNALAALAAVTATGVPLADAVDALAGFNGARRRLQLLADAGGIRVFDDYAHHPTAVSLMIEALRRQVPSGGRLWAVFQPHLRTRTEELFDEFSGAFAGADTVVLTDVYSPAGREPEGSYRGTPELIRAMRHPNARHVPTLDEVRELLRADLRSGDVVLMMGAGSIERLIPLVAQDVKERAGADHAG